MKNFSLSRNERIKKKKDFEHIFSSGKVIYSKYFLFKSIYFINTDVDEGNVKIASAVSRKAGKSVWRNRVKRLIRETYRLNKKLIVEVAKEKNFEVMIVFSSNKINEKKFSKVKLSDVSFEIVDLMEKIYQLIR